MPQTSTVQGKKKGLSATQLFLPIAEIRDDVVVLKNGGMRAVLQVSSVNFNLKSEEEQNALIYAYQSFLNILDFPVQIVARSKKLDIDSYLDGFEVVAKNQKDDLLKNLSYDYIEYIKKLVEYADIMEKQFYVVIPYDPIRSRERGALSVFMEALHPQSEVADIRQRHYEFDALKKGLSTRVDVARSGLEGCGLAVNQATTVELVELYYQSFNPLTARNQKIKHIEEEDLMAV